MFVPVISHLDRSVIFVFFLCSFFIFISFFVISLVIHEADYSGSAFSVYVAHSLSSYVVNVIHCGCLSDHIYSII